MAQIFSTFLWPPEPLLQYPCVCAQADNILQICSNCPRSRSAVVLEFPNMTAQIAASCSLQDFAHERRRIAKAHPYVRKGAQQGANQGYVNGGFQMVVRFCPENEFRYPLLPQFNLMFTSILPQFNLFFISFLPLLNLNLTSASSGI